MNIDFESNKNVNTKSNDAIILTSVLASMFVPLPGSAWPPTGPKIQNLKKYSKNCFWIFSRVPLKILKNGFWISGFLQKWSKNNWIMIKKWSPGRPRLFFDYFLKFFYNFSTIFQINRKAAFGRHPTGVGGLRPPTPVGFFCFFWKMVEK